MRIIQLIQRPQLRGAEIFACQLSNHLQKSGHKVTLICLAPGSASLPFSGTIIHLDRPLSRRFFDIRGWRLLSKEIKKLQPDLVQANAGDTLKYSVFSRWVGRWKTPIVYRNANKVSDFADSWIKKMFNRFLVSRIDGIVSVSEQCRLDLIRTYSVNPRKAITIPIGIERTINSQSLPEDLEAFFKGRLVLVQVASFVPEKNHTGMLDILERIGSNRPDVMLLLVGDGQLRTKIMTEIQQRKLEKKVFLAGYRSDVLPIISRASALVLPSLIEGLPAVILEAMYARTLVVAYDVGGIGEVLRNGETGWLVPKNDTDGFVRAVQKVLDGQEKEMITNRAYNLVSQDFDNTVIAKRFEQAYNSLVTTKQIG